MTRKQAFLNGTIAACVGLSVLTGCAQTNNGFSNQNQGKNQNSTASKAVESDALKLARDGVALIQEGDFVGASHVFNSALKLEITNSSLQFLNGLAYHLRALKGDVTFFPLAEQGYQLAIQYDPSNWFAYYYAGLARMDQIGRAHV